MLRAAPKHGCGHLRTGLACAGPTSIGMVRSRDLRPNLNVVIAALAVGIFAAWVGCGLGGASVVRYVDDLATPAAVLAATVSCALAARRHESQPRLFWSLLAAASAAWAAGELIWAYYDLVLGDGPVVSWADIGYLAAIPLAAAALLAHPDWQRSAAHKTRSVLDGLAIGAALFFLLWTWSSARCGARPI
jgi:hypothetical protein